MSGYQVDNGGQFYTTLIAVAVGASLCLLYDVFRIIRMAHRTSYAAVFFQDVLYCFISAVITYGFLLVRCSGVVRIYPLIGELIGFICCRFTLSIPIMKAAKAAIHAARRAANWVKRVILPPLSRVISAISKALKKITEKINDLLKNLLKRVTGIVYNHVKLHRRTKQGSNEHESQ